MGDLDRETGEEVTTTGAVAGVPTTVGVGLLVSLYFGRGTSECLLPDGFPHERRLMVCSDPGELEKEGSLILLSTSEDTLDRHIKSELEQKSEKYT